MKQPQKGLTKSQKGFATWNTNMQKGIVCAQARKGTDPRNGAFKGLTRKACLSLPFKLLHHLCHTITILLHLL